MKNVLLLVVFLLTTATSFSQTKPDIKNIFDAEDRVLVHMPDHALLGQPIEMRIEFTSANITYFGVTQADGSGQLKNSRNGKDISEGTVVRNDGLTKTIEITPLALGMVTVRILAVFADGGICQKAYKLRVDPSSKGLQHFYLHEGLSELAIVLEEKESDRQRGLSPIVRYYGLDDQIYLRDATQLEFTVVQPKDHPVIRLDPNGLVHGLRPGTAKITSEFDGISASVNATVYDRHKAPAGFAMNYCEAQFTQGFQLPNSGLMSKEETARRATQQRELRAFLWNNWTQNRRACASELVENRKGDSLTNLFEFEPDENGVWSVYGSWLKFQNWRQSEGEFRAYSLSRVIRNGDRERVLTKDEKHVENDYLLVFKDAKGKTVLSY